MRRTALLALVTLAVLALPGCLIAYEADSDTWHSRGAEGTIKSRLGDLPATWVINQHLADMAVHGWDIARATGQSTDLDTGVAQTALEWARGALKPELRGTAFGPEVEVPASAPVYDRLAGFFGRVPATE